MALESSLVNWAQSREETVSELEDSSIEITQNEKMRENKEKEKRKEHLRLGGQYHIVYCKHTRILEREERWKRSEEFY